MVTGDFAFKVTDIPTDSALALYIDHHLHHPHHHHHHPPDVPRAEQEQGQGQCARGNGGTRHICRLFLLYNYIIVYHQFHIVVMSFVHVQILGWVRLLARSVCAG